MSGIFYRSYDVIDFYMKQNLEIDEFQSKFYSELGNLIKNPELQPEIFKVNREYFINALMQNRQPGALLWDLVALSMNNVKKVDGSINLNIELDIFKGGPMLSLNKVSIYQQKLGEKSYISLSPEEKAVTIYKSSGKNKNTFIQENCQGNNFVFLGINNDISCKSQFESDVAIDRNSVIEL